MRIAIGMLITTLLGFTSVYGNENWLRDSLKRTDQETTDWMKNLITEQKSQTPKDTSFKELLKKQCNLNYEPVQNTHYDLFVFLSFSVPDETWLSLSHQLKDYNGVIVLRGIPQNSFKQFYLKIQNLNNKGFSAPLEINPSLYEKYQITEVPSFVLIEGDKFDKLSGNVSISFAKELSEKTGDIKKHSKVGFVER